MLTLIDRKKKFFLKLDAYLKTARSISFKNGPIQSLLAFGLSKNVFFNKLAAL